MKHLNYLLLLLAILLLAGLPTAAQDGDEDDVCALLVEAALTAVGENCADLDRDTACYGHDRVDAAFWTDPINDRAFATPADRTPLADLQTIRTAPLA